MLYSLGMSVSAWKGWKTVKRQVLSTSLWCLRWHDERQPMPLFWYDDIEKIKKEREIIGCRGDPCNLAVFPNYKATFLVSPISLTAICAEPYYLSGQNIKNHSIKVLGPLKWRERTEKSFQSFHMKSHCSELTKINAVNFQWYCTI